eukprot:10917316-Lingulodinium_polyedra.AAC.1
MLALREDLALGLELGAEAPPQVELCREVVHAPAPARVGVELGLFTVHEVRVAAADLVELAPELEPTPDPDCLGGRREVVVEEKLDVRVHGVREVTDLGGASTGCPLTARGPPLLRHQSGPSRAPPLE